MDAAGSTLQQLSDSFWMALATRLRGALEKDWVGEDPNQDIPRRLYLMGFVSSYIMCSFLLFDPPPFDST